MQTGFGLTAVAVTAAPGWTISKPRKARTPMKSARLYDPQRRGRRFAVGWATMHDRPLEHRPHPWHGVDPGKRFPEIVRAY
jgi:hypothetical protein